MKIAIYGPMCSGKSTIANIIQKKYPQYKIYSFGQKIKDLASELFDMKGKNRSLLITIADKMRAIDEDVWAKYIVKQTQNKEHCLIDDLRFQNELDHLHGWKIICLTTPKEIRLQRLKKLYPENYEDHIKNMSHKSETDTLNFPNETIYIDTNVDASQLKETLKISLKIE